MVHLKNSARGFFFFGSKGAQFDYPESFCQRVVFWFGYYIDPKI